MTLEISTAICVSPMSAKGSLTRAWSLSARAPPVGGEVVGLEPVLPQHDRVGRDLADVLDEARKVEGDLRIGRAVVGDGGCHGLGGAEPVDLDDVGNDRALRGLPDERRAEAAGHRQAAEGHEPPVARLHAGRADALVPDLRRLLVGGDRLRGLRVAHARSPEHQGFSERLTAVPPPPWSPERIACAAVDSPWWRDCWRFSRRAQAGGPSLAGTGAAAPPGKVPPVTVKAAREPAR